MEVKAGYKQTEVGAIPASWDVVSIESISKVVRGGSPRPAGNPRYFNGNFIPWLTVAALTNIPASQNYVFETETFLTEDGSKHSRTLEVGTLILSNSGATLGVAKILAIKCCANDGVAAFLDLDRRVNKVYLYHYLNTQTDQLRSVVARGNGQPNLNTTLIGGIKIPLPAPFEQEAIAVALSDADALIEALEGLLAKKRQVKQGAMQELLTGKKRLVESGKWEVKRLGDECELITKGTTPTSLGKDFTNNGINFIKVETLDTDGKILDDMVAFIDEETHKLLKRSQLKEGDLLISIAGALGRTGIVEKNILPANTNQALAIARLRSGARLNLLYVYHYLKTAIIKKHIEGISVQGAQANLSLQNIADLPLNAPDLSEQTVIAEILSDMDAEITALEGKLSKARQVKQGMMQELLTGRTRLVNSAELIVKS